MLSVSPPQSPTPLYGVPSGNQQYTQLMGSPQSQMNMQRMISALAGQGGLGGHGNAAGPKLGPVQQGPLGASMAPPQQGPGAQQTQNLGMYQ